MTTVAHPPLQPGLGTGIYTLGEAAWLLKVTPARLRRWANGYEYAGRDGTRESAPILDRPDTTSGLITFYELIELCFVREFVRAGVKLPEIRAAADVLRREWDTPYPFAKRTVYTDGRRLLVAAGDNYRTITDKQGVFAYIERFFQDIDVDEDTLAQRWWPMGKGHLVVLDPKRGFGAPIDVRSGVRTRVLYDSWLAEQDFEAVAEWYEVAEDAVRDAVAFEEQWRARTAA